MMTHCTVVSSATDTTRIIRDSGSSWDLRDPSDGTWSPPVYGACGPQLVLDEQKVPPERDETESAWS